MFLEGGGEGVEGDDEGEDESAEDEEEGEIELQEREKAFRLTASYVYTRLRKEFGKPLRLEV